jgi:hypothetical protein
MKTKLSIFLLIFCSIVSAQTHRFIYHVEYKKDTTSSFINKEYYHLDISGSIIDYYKRDFFIADSLINNNSPFPELMQLNTSQIISHRRGSDEFEEFDLLENTVLNLQTQDAQEWKLINEKKEKENWFYKKQQLLGEAENGLRGSLWKSHSRKDHTNFMVYQD